MTPAERMKKIKLRGIAAALIHVLPNLRELTKDELMALDKAVTEEFIQRMKEDKGMEART